MLSVKIFSENFTLGQFYLSFLCGFLGKGKESLNIWSSGSFFFKIYINDDPGLFLTYFMASSNLSQAKGGGGGGGEIFYI